MRSSRPTRWSCRPYDVGEAARLADAAGLSPAVASVLVRRGISSPEEARSFLAAEDRHAAEEMAGVREACAAIIGHVERGSSIVVYGDYDVDGVCSTTILVRALRAIGAQPSWELPSRFGDGYGLSRAAVERLAAAGAGLIVTVDCGITAVEEVAAARAAGMDIVVTDHHRPGDQLPDCTIVHPALGAYPCPELCAAGVALKLSEALRTAAGLDPLGAEEDLDLAALATVCDLVPLRGENRRIVRQGLRRLAATRKPGLRALMDVSGCAPADISEQGLGFRLGPRINAAGRMQRADAALELMLTDDAERAAEVAQELDFLNRDRQEAEQRIVFAAEAACAPQASAGALVVAGEGWHPGVVGIVASRLTERFGRPSVVIALDGESGKGSCRSVSAYDLHAGLSACSEHLLRFGGHKMAAGLEIERDRIDDFRRALAQHAGSRLSPEDLVPVERVDAVVSGGDLGLPLAEELERLRPFGMGNPQPTLLVPGAKLEMVTKMGQEGEHARFTLSTPGSRSRGVAFGATPGTLKEVAQAPHDIALRLELNRWNGITEPRVVLRAACPARHGSVRVLGEEGPFWEELARASEPSADALPERRTLRDRRAAGGGGVVADLLTSGGTVLVAVAHVGARMAALEERLSSFASEALCVASWQALASSPELAEPFDHVVALDPPPDESLPASLPSLGSEGMAHLAWGPAEVDFALAVYRSELDLRPLLIEVYRAVREAGSLGGSALAQALRGGGRHPRSAVCCARLLRVLGELDLVAFDPSVPEARLLEAAPTDLERSPSFRDAAERLEALERRLLPKRATAPTPAAAAA